MSSERNFLKPLALAVLSFLFISLTACGGGSDGSSGIVTSTTTTTDASLLDTIEALTPTYLSAEEEQSLIFMREEEKLARDVYQFLYGIWAENIFLNIAESEQRHTDAVLALIEKYSLPDPAAGNAPGEFQDQNLQGLYDILIARGQASLIDALIVGAQIEDLDINDLNLQLQIADNADVILVYNSLLEGSQNHLRAFISQLTALGFEYVPEYISQELFDAIINSPAETGP